MWLIPNPNIEAAFAYANEVRRIKVAKAIEAARKDYEVVSNEEKPRK